MNRRKFLTVSSLLAAASLALPPCRTAIPAAAAPGAAGRASRKNTVIDFESHYIDREIYEYLRKRTEPPFYNETTGMLASFGDCPEMQFKAPVENLLDVGAGRIRHMDAAGIDIMLISSTVPLEVTFTKEESTRMMPGVNNRLAETVAKNPSRFRAMAAISPHDPGKAAAEIKRCATELGMTGWHLHSHFLGNEYPDHPKYLPMWQMVSDLDFPVYLHPTAASMPALSGYGFAMSGSPFGFAIDATICLARLICSGLFEKFPNIKIVTGHMGETIPYLIQRMDHQLATKGGWNLPRMPGEYLRKNVMFSTSGSFSKEVFGCMKSVVGIERIVFASDWAYEDLPACTEFIDSLGLTAEEASMLYSGNAARELRIA